MKRRDRLRAVFFVSALIAYLEPMSRSPLKLPPEVAKAFVKDMRAFFKAKNQLEGDEIAARQCWALKEHLPRGSKLRILGCQRDVSADARPGIKETNTKRAGERPRRLHHVETASRRASPTAPRATSLVQGVPLAALVYIRRV